MFQKKLFLLLWCEIYFTVLTNPSIIQSVALAALLFLSMLRYFIIHKPYNTLSQFTTADDKKTLADYYTLPQDVYAVGRLDYDSEGLLILTNDKKLNHLLLNPSFTHAREYWVQVDGAITKDATAMLEKGVRLSINGKVHITQPAIAHLFETAPPVQERNPPIRYRKNIPTSWLSLTLTEGKNRQVRKMTASVGYPTLRLIRYRIEQITLQDLAAGEIRELSKKTIYQQLNIPLH